MVNRNFLYVAIGVLAVVGVALGYQSYREHQRASGLQIDVGNGGISVQTK
jgi:hypothetical protein